jgi:hypothetical protein
MNMRMPSRLVCAVRALDSWPAGASMSGLQRSHTADGILSRQQRQHTGPESSDYAPGPTFVPPWGQHSQAASASFGARNSDEWTA